MQENRAAFRDLRRDNEQMKQECRETRRVADKALIATEDTKKRVISLEDRVSKLEKGPIPGAGAKGGARGSAMTEGPRDWELIGGESGDTIALGGFRQWASYEERLAETDALKTSLPERLALQIGDTIVPRAPGGRVMIKISPKATVKETRAAMFAWCKDFKECRLKMQLPDEAEGRLATATPSKPFELRKRDAQLLSLLSGLKLIASEEQKEKFIPDLGNGRIFLNRTLLADRPSRDLPPEPKIEAINAIWPGTTAEILKAKVAEAEALREAAAKGR